ncbi:uncharacterized protein RAG0_10447 [Rhynchosporium agropyri]|uniref:Uncharacterized protein n=2 Tax=Rhynchosporium TaxID=38037 RepID=A0A1E1KZX8_9HELO|nr:uncharacterized protein RCO7_03027 [Rhynchosporium commune]CZT03809.1 uncharacterized protein RAG0_10447 [Rhynchosporium agropyri]
MASSTEQPPFSDPFTASNKNSSAPSQDLPIHSSSNTQTETKTCTPISPGSDIQHVSIPDGRRNSQGEALHSPTENWKPNFKRVQSFKFDDLKRDVYVKNEIMEEEPNQGAGFTEGGEGTRQV